MHWRIVTRICRVMRDIDQLQLEDSRYSSLVFTDHCSCPHPNYTCECPDGDTNACPGVKDAPVEAQCGPLDAGDGDGVADLRDEEPDRPSLDGDRGRCPYVSAGAVGNHYNNNQLTLTGHSMSCGTYCRGH